jgi:hypothetical protein
MYCDDCTLLLTTRLKVFHFTFCQLYCIPKDSTVTDIQETQISFIHGYQRYLNSASEIPRHPVYSSCLLLFYNVPYVKCGNQNMTPTIFISVHAQISAKAVNYGLQCGYSVSASFS